MSGDEVAVLVVSSVMALYGWVVWYTRPLGVQQLGAAARGRGLLFTAPLVCAGILALVLVTLAASDVRDAPRYIALYMVIGAAWIVGAARSLPLVGISARDDVAERRNPAAAVAIAGALVGITLCFAGGNIGNGPGWWVVLFSAGVATGALLLLGILLEMLTGISDSVTIDRDVAAGVRLGAFFVASGLVLGRAVAGDWISSGDTVRDFARTAWPAVLLLGAAVLMERAAHPTINRPVAPAVSHGVLPGVILLLAATLYVASLGVPG
jgi:uncharacterized membrane protein YjfL (UPF0719 family)